MGGLVGNKSRYKRVVDLYTQGTEVVLRDGTVAWLQVLSPFEIDDARHDAQVARSRLLLALKEMGSPEQDAARGAFLTESREEAIELLIAARGAEWSAKVYQEIRDDPDWAERMKLLDEADAIVGEGEPAERELLAKINTEYIGEYQRRLDAEAANERRLLEPLGENDLLERYMEHYRKHRGNIVALAEYQVAELMYAARVCEATTPADGETWDHDGCAGHRERIYDGDPREAKAEIRALPEELQELYFDRMRELNMSVREAKNSDRQGSSSASSPLPATEGESTPSTPTETPVGAPGT